mmetsp:Transcript_102213/g.288766  ORF Transcript_102213/g.288766 Transcript_102213/m.288766 type:complete len:244 (+) Transcript_102213:431-1162(+)
MSLRTSAMLWPKSSRRSLRLLCSALRITPVRTCTSARESCEGSASAALCGFASLVASSRCAQFWASSLRGSSSAITFGSRHHMSSTLASSCEFSRSIFRSAVNTCCESFIAMFWVCINRSSKSLWSSRKAAALLLPPPLLSWRVASLSGMRPFFPFLSWFRKNSIVFLSSSPMVCSMHSTMLRSRRTSSLRSTCPRDSKVTGPLFFISNFRCRSCSSKCESWPSSLLYMSPNLLPCSLSVTSQ